MIDFSIKVFNYIDFLSPPITLYHLENRTHTSKMGGFPGKASRNAITAHIWDIHPIN